MIKTIERTHKTELKHLKDEYDELYNKHQGIISTFDQRTEKEHREKWILTLESHCLFWIMMDKLADKCKGDITTFVIPQIGNPPYLDDILFNALYFEHLCWRRGINDAKFKIELKGFINHCRSDYFELLLNSVLRSSYVYNSSLDRIERESKDYPNAFICFRAFVTQLKSSKYERK